MNVCMYMTETGDMGERVMVFTLLFLLMKGPLLIQWIKMYMCNNVVKVNNKMNEFSNINESNVCYELFFFPWLKLFLHTFLERIHISKGIGKCFHGTKHREKKKQYLQYWTIEYCVVAKSKRQRKIYEIAFNFWDNNDVNDPLIINALMVYKIQSQYDCGSIVFSLIITHFHFGRQQ